MNEKPIIICLTPVRNEAWILNRFLKAAGLWADHIIIADQKSTDESREIAQKHSKVILIDNPSGTYNEAERQKLLIDEARKIKGPRLLITLDADEIFTPDILTSAEWQTVLESSPGTIFKFQWANICPDLQNMWIVKSLPWGYMDDGYEHTGPIMHSDRVPLPPDHNVVLLNQIKVIHFQYTHWERMQSKHRWYQCYEKINFPEKSAINIFRTYHHMYAIPESQLIPVPLEWIKEYDRLGIDIISVCHEKKIWWDEQVLQLIEQYGGDFFKKINIWDVNWANKAKLWGKTNTDIYKDPRNRIDKYIHSWLMKTQKNHEKRVNHFIEKAIRFVFRY